nr:hypothetical protein [Tanacetum cinerariifolium]
VVDDYSRYTWVFFLYSKDEAIEVIISFIKKTQVNLQLYVQRVRTDNARTPQQNGVMERRNRTLVEATRTMLTFANLPSFLWAEAIAIACFTQNRSIIHNRFDKTPYELMNKRKSNIKFFRVFECRCYLFNDYEEVGKLKANGDIGVFVEYSKESAAFKIYNKRTQEVILPQRNTQSISNNRIPNVDEASTSYNVFNERLKDDYFDAIIKRIFRYLKGTINLGLWYPKDSGFDLTAYSDADHAGCHLDQKKSEYVAVSSSCAQVLWMRTQLTDYGFFYDKVSIYCDSKSAIAISCNS